MELVAWGEPLAVRVLELLVDKDAVQAAEERGLLVLERSGRRIARPARPPAVWRGAAGHPAAKPSAGSG